LFLFLFLVTSSWGWTKSDEARRKIESMGDDKKDEKEDENDPKNWPLKKGNLSLPISQQPGPLVGFGENIVDKGQKQLFLMGQQYTGHHQYLTSLIPGFVYGIKESLSLFLNFPVSPGNKSQGNHSSGMQDIFIQLESVFIDKNRKYSTDQATVVGNFTIPTGSANKKPPTGVGSPSFFLGMTYNHTNIKWLYLVQSGVVLTTSYHGTKFGNQALYQIGFERCLWTPKGWIIAVLVEGDGTYSGRNRISGHIDRNSGGNVFYVTPSLWISSEHLIIQIGVGYPVAQHLFGHQPRLSTSYVFNLGLTF
jgi:hypothetical protein